MAAIDLADELPVRCAPWTREQGVDPIGSMGIYRSFLLVEWPLPWPHDLAEIPALGTLGPTLLEAGCRLQGVVPAGDSTQRRVVLYYRSGQAFDGFHRQERVVAPSDVIDAARQLLSSEWSPSSPALGRDVLVCTHGRRDRCCGSTGTELALQLQADPDALGPSTRVGRTSHTGGHRFGPTSVVFPEGTGWAFADVELLSRVVNRQGPINEVIDHYRGCAGLESSEAQVVERGVLAEIGWDLFDLPRWSSKHEDGKVRLHIEAAGGADVWEGIVGAGRVLPVPECGSPLTTSRKTSTEYILSDLRRI